MLRFREHDIAVVGDIKNMFYGLKYHKLNWCEMFALYCTIR